MGKKVLLRVIVMTTLAVLLGIVLSILTVNTVNLTTARNDLRSNTESVRADIAACDTIERLQAYLSANNNDFLRISVFDPSGEPIAESDGERLDPQLSYERAVRKAAERGEAFQIGGAYVGERSLMYYTRIDAPALEGYDMLIVRTAAAHQIGGQAFAVSVAIGAVIWLAIVLMSFVAMRSAIRTAMRPLKDVELMLERISRGDYRKLRDYPSTGTEFDRLYRQINEIGGTIADSVRELRHEQRKNRLLMRSINQGVIGLSQKGTVMLTNDAVGDIFGLESHIVGMSVDMLIEDETLLETLNAALGERKYTVSILDLGKNCYRVETLFPNEQWHNEIGSLGMLLVLTNITQEIRSAHIRTEFFANASHELKTPLTAIGGYSELITMDGATDEQIRHCAGEINANARKMKELIDGMLALSKLDADIRSEDIEMTDIRPLCEQVVDQQRVIAQSRNVSVEIVGEARMPARPQMMRVLIENLVNNAIKYNRDGGSVRIELRSDADTVQLRVQDTGIGIAPEYQGRLFERFYKVDGSRRRTHESSTGLGLAIVKHIALQHKGTISVESKQGAGTTFVVVFRIN